MGFHSARAAGLSPTSRPQVGGRDLTFKNKGAGGTIRNYDAFNADVKNWADDTEGKLKSAAPKATGALKSSIKRNLNKQSGVIGKISFGMKRYGVFVEKGVGRGRRSGSNNVKPHPWFNKTMDSAVQELGDIAQTHYADITVKNIRIG